MSRLPIFLVFSVGCVDFAVVDTSPAPRTNTDRDLTIETTLDPPTNDASAPDFDCDALPDVPLSQTPVDGALADLGLVIDTSGWLYGGDGRHLFKTDGSGLTVVEADNVGALQQLALLPGGDLLLASDDDGGLVRMPPAGEAIRIATGDFYGLAAGPDGLVFGSDRATGSLVRIDPEGEGFEAVVTLGAGSEPRAVALDLVGPRLLWSEVDRAAIYQLWLDDELQPLGDVEILATGVGLDGASRIDAIVVDACGNAYASEYETASIYRISADGVVTHWLEGADYAFEALTFGAGDGWDALSLYASQPDNGHSVVRLEAGVPEQLP